MSMLPAVQQRIDEWWKQNSTLSVPRDSFGSGRMAWIDVETGGLNPHTDDLLEVACMVTDQYGYALGSFESIIVPHYVRDKENIELLTARLDPFVLDMHTKSGLLEEIDQYHRGSAWTLGQCEDELSDFLRGFFIDENKVPMAGSSVSFDRSFLDVNMPNLTKTFFTYRNIDISSTKEQVALLNPDLLPLREKWWNQIKAHRGTPDLIDTIQEYRFYLSEFYWTKENAQGINTDFAGASAGIKKDNEA